jgi:acyl phosphate:glycerol-3-phosphate acyltransferase
VVAVALARIVAPAAPAAPAVAALAVVAGHIHPVQLGFRGGKGLATGFGAVAVAAPLAACVSAGVALAWVAATRRAVEAALIAVAVLPIVVLSTRTEGVGSLALVLLAGLILIRHASVIAEIVAARRSPTR